MEKSGSVYISAENASLPLLEKSGYVDIRAENASLPLLEKSGSVNIRAENASLPVLTEVSRSFKWEGKHTINGDTFNVLIIDDMPTILGKWKTKDGVKSCKAWYARNFGKDNPVRREENKCYVASLLGVFAHGETLRKAHEDLDYKIKANAGRSDAIISAVKSGGFDMPTWRASSGACRDGTIAWLRDKGITKVPEFIPMLEAKSLMSGSSYGREVIAMIEAIEVTA